MQATPPPCLFPSKLRVLWPSISTTESNMELSNFDSEIPITATLDWQARRWSSSILGKRLFMLTCIKWSPGALKMSHSLLSEVWLIWEGPRFKLRSSKDNRSNLKKESFILYLHSDSKKNTKALWIWDVCNKLLA